MNKKDFCWIFNPEHDMALADDKTSYIPPSTIRKMADDLALLPVWFADIPGCVLAASAYNSDYLNWCKTLFDLPLRLMTRNELSTASDIEFFPWGWDRPLVNNLQQCGVRKNDLPGDGYLSLIRCLSHRSQAIELFTRLNYSPNLCGGANLLTTLDECRNFVETHPRAVLKAPLSGSGKGLNWCKGQFTPLIESWCKRLLSTQQGVIAESVYDKVLDFAMEFYLDGVQPVGKFIGYSLFETSASGAYEGNLLCSDQYIEDQIARFVSKDLVEGLKQQVAATLGRLLSGYKGYVGVDMMVCRFSDEPIYRVHPSVEINLRLNMGVVAHQVYKNYVVPQRRGVYKVVRHPSGEEALKWHQEMQAQYPLVVEDGRVASGYLALTPVVRHTQYVSAIWIE